MSDDLVKRLRQYPDVKLPNEAADRIEKLKAALDDMAQFVSQEDWDCFLKPETRKALEGKDD